MLVIIYRHIIVMMLVVLLVLEKAGADNVRSYNAWLC